MIRLLTENDRKSVLDYLYQDINFNIFPIGDIENFGFETDFQRVYADFNEHGQYLSVLLRYRENAIYYSHLSLFNKEYLVMFDNDPFKFLSGKLELIALIEPYLDQFIFKKMYFCAAREIKHMVKFDQNIVKEVKTQEECEKLYELLIQIEEFGISRMSKETFVSNKLTSLKMGKVLYIEENNQIVSTVATSAETTKNAMVVGVATDENYRMKGYATTLLLSLMDLYLNEKKKELCLFYNNPKAGKIYLRLGFEYVGLWMMCERKQL